MERWISLSHYSNVLFSHPDGDLLSQAGGSFRYVLNHNWVEVLMDF
jgi:hypothetical protein